MAQVRVMTYNLLMGGRRGEALNRVVREARPDVLVVNEAPKAPFASQRRCRALAEVWELTFAGGGRDAGSNAVMIGARVEIERVASRTFNTLAFRPRRGIVAAQLRIENSMLGVVGCHLSLERAYRAREVEAVIEAARAMRGVVVVAGDLNEPPSGPSWRRLRQVGFADHGSNDWPTFPAQDPVKRIDALLVRGEAVVLRHGDPGVPLGLQAQASDHRAVLAVLDI